MAYNRRHFLERVIEIQDIVKAEKKHGKSQTWIFDNIIKKLPHVRISRSTFNNYMCINARRELAKLASTGSATEDNKESLTVINQ